MIARIEHAPVARAVARAAYRAGAAYVDVAYSDQHVRRAMIEQAADDVLSWTPPWILERAKNFGEENAAIVALVGDAEPELLADLPGDRVGKARMKALGEELTHQTNEGLNNWVVTGVPNAGWATQLFGNAGRGRSVGPRRVLRAARRGRSGRRLARARREARRTRESPQRHAGSTRCAIAAPAPT